MHNSKHSDCTLLCIYNKHLPPPPQKKNLKGSSGTAFKLSPLPGQLQSKVAVTHECAEEPQLIPLLPLLLSPHFRNVLTSA